MNKHPDCEDRCQILEHKGYHTCSQTGQCEKLLINDAEKMVNARIVPTDTLRRVIDLLPHIDTNYQHQMDAAVVMLYLKKLLEKPNMFFDESQVMP